MKDTKDKVVFEFKLPGIKEEDISVNIIGGALRIEAHSENEKERESKGTYRRESTARSFEYETSLPEVIPEKMKTTFKKDILKIVIPKK